MASENSDSEIMNEWTILSSVNGEDEVCQRNSFIIFKYHTKYEDNMKSVTEKPAETNKEENCGNGEIETANHQEITVSEVGKQKTQKEIATVQPEVTTGEDKSFSISKKSHLSSEIDVLKEEDNIDDSRKLLSTKNSEYSSTNCTGIEVIHEDLSDASGLSYVCDELLTDVDMKPGVRHYVHKPNTRLNLILNLVVALAVTAVVGFGVGHFLGWSHQWLCQKQVTHGQVLKLKQLEEELIKCMEQENQQTLISQDSTFFKTYEEVKHQEKESHKRLRVLEDENIELKSKLELEKEDDKVLEEKVNKLNEENFELKAKLVKEEEDDKMLERKVNELNEENIELKAKLIEEEEDDKILAKLEQKMENLMKENILLKTQLATGNNEKTILANLEGEVREIHLENLELKKTLEELQSQLFQSTSLQNAENLKKTGSNLKIDTLRKQTNALVTENRQLKTSIDQFKDSILSRTEENQHELLNELQLENQDLKNEIGQLRYMKPPNRQYYMSDVPTNDQSVASDLNTEETTHNGMESLLQMLDTAHQESRHWEKLYKQMKSKLDKKKTLLNEISLPYENWAEAITTGFTNGSKAVTNIITSVLDHISQQNVTFSDVMHVQLNATEVVFRNIKHNLAEKWRELQMITDFKQFKQFANQTEKLITRMSQTLQSAVQKIQDIGDKFVQSQKPLESRMNKLGQKVLKVIDRLEEQWADMQRKWSKKVLKQQSLVGKKFYEDVSIGNKNKDELFLKQGSDYEKKISDRTDNNDRYFQKNVREKQIQKKKENRLKYKKRKKDSNEHTSEGLLSLKDKYRVKEQNYLR
ncbi:uncharacterized protein LOC143256725 isoform X4 [Tachypleus tridentatus]|uniref:uncharacterized protein LOC143256725 isoform X4 n=1 Tax=Tachypleus tridentatus TaxID=6853 RepID=UPI003FD57BCE